MKLLVLSGADPNRRHSVSAESALISAVIQNDAHLVGFLLSRGAIARTQYSVVLRLLVIFDLYARNYSE